VNSVCRKRISPLLARLLLLLPDIPARALSLSLSLSPYRLSLIRSASDRAHFFIDTFLRVSPAYFLSRCCAISLPPRLCQSLSLSLSLSPSLWKRTGPRGSPSNWFHSRGDRLSSRLRTGTTGIQSPRRSVASTACRRRLSNVLSSDNYADEAVSYDNAAEDPVAFPVAPAGYLRLEYVASANPRLVFPPFPPLSSSSLSF